MLNKSPSPWGHSHIKKKGCSPKFGKEPRRFKDPLWPWREILSLPRSTNSYIAHYLLPDFFGTIPSLKGTGTSEAPAEWTF